VQSVGAETDKPLRDLIDEGAVAGPRILTSLGSFNERSGTPEEIRDKVRKKFADGADLIKLFATASSRDGGKQTMSDAQIEAACSESKALGKRAAVHAHAAGGAKPAVLSGCTSIEHGTFLTDEVLDLMAQRGVYLDTNLSNVPNYINHKEAFLGLGNFTEKGFEEMAKDLPIRIDTLQRAMAKKVKIVFGTDAVAGLHGHNAEEFILRVRDGHQPAMDAIVSAASRAAESIGLANRIGTITSGMEADLVATDGNPLDDITNVRNVAFVMKAGRVYKNLAPPVR
jgi:imidazolonepropionase-like amidohydrolase